MYLQGQDNTKTWTCKAKAKSKAKDFTFEAKPKTEVTSSKTEAYASYIGLAMLKLFIFENRLSGVKNTIFRLLFVMNSPTTLTSSVAPISLHDLELMRGSFTGRCEILSSHGSNTGATGG